MLLSALLSPGAWAYTGTGTSGDPYLVSNWADLKTTMNAGGYIRLEANCTDGTKSSDSYLVVPNSTTVVLNLNGKTINRGLGNNTEGIQYGFVIKNLGTLTINGSGTITGGYSDEGGGGIYNIGTLTINNATISGNKTRYWGAGICSENAYSSTTIDGATISNNTSGQDGGGICVLAGSLTISNTTIKGNTAKNNGGGICYQPYSTCSFSMTSGSISNNTAYSGGGIYFTVGNSVNINYTWDFHIQGGSITHNTATVCGGGVYVASRTTLKISGNITINNNVNHEDVVDNVLLRSADTPAMIQIANSLNTNSRIGITIKNSSFESDLRVFTSGLSGKGSLTNFTSDDTSCALYLQGGEARLKGIISPSVSMAGWTYGGTATNPSVSGNTGNGTITYTYKAAGASTFSSTKPTNAGTHTVKATIAESTDYLGGEATNTYTVAKASISPSVSMAGWTYGGTATNPSVSGNTGNGSVTYSYKAAGASSFNSTKPTNAGTHTVKATIAESANYLGGEATNTYTVAKANLSVTAPTAASLTYNRNNQNLLATNGSATGGTFYYKVGSGSWGTSLPQGKNADTYTVSYYVKGDTNHNDAGSTSSPKGSVSCTIGKIAVKVSGITASDKTYDGNTTATIVTTNASFAGIIH